MNIYQGLPRPSRIRISALRLVSAIGAVGLSAFAGPKPSTFNDIVQSPSSYEGKEVTITGVAHVDGVSFTLFQPPDREISRSIAVVQKIGPPLYNALNNHWVEVRGILDASRRGSWDFACRIYLEAVRPVDRPPIKGIETYGIFLNEGPGLVKLDLSNRLGNEHTEIRLAPDGIEKTEVVEGIAKIFSVSGAELSQCEIPSEKSAPGFFDASGRTFYFRIHNGSIALVRPDVAGDLKRRWTRVEDRN